MKTSTFKKNHKTNLGRKKATITEKAKKPNPKWSSAILLQLSEHFGVEPKIAQIKQAILNNPELAKAWDDGIRPKKQLTKEQLNQHKQISKFHQFAAMLKNPANFDLTFLDVCNKCGINEDLGYIWKMKIEKNNDENPIPNHHERRIKEIEELISSTLFKAFKQMDHALNSKNKEEIMLAKEMVSIAKTLQETYTSSIKSKKIKKEAEPFAQLKMPQIEFQTNIKNNNNPELNDYENENEENDDDGFLNLAEQVLK